jgi:hypothetical protein
MKKERIFAAVSAVIVAGFVTLSLISCQLDRVTLTPMGEEAAGRLVDAITDRIIDEIGSAGSDVLQEPETATE